MSHLTLTAFPFKHWLGTTTLWLLAILKPLGAWGILGIAIVDSGAIPMLFLDPLIVSYGVAAPARVALYCFMGALGSAIGALLPYYLGRVGGELFLLKRINRQRYEQLRDRFQKQEFLAILLPAMCPPPMPVKVVAIAAGVLEMRAVSYFLAIFCGKFLRFLIESALVILYGPQLLSTALAVFRHHAGLAFAALGLVVLAILIYILRKVFAPNRPTPLPMEDPTDPKSEPDIARPAKSS
jgi:membrane protein YqaA with SNARE-associated domain